MKTMQLNHEQVALLDDGDYDRVVSRGWYAAWDKHAKSYVAYSTDRPRVALHRFILSVRDSTPVDHANGNRLDNRRQNLRLCTKSQNAMNQRKQQRPTTSRYKGVNFDTRSGKWRVTVGFNGRRVHLGYYDDEAEAALAYNVAAIKLFGKFARPNPITHTLGTHTHGSLECDESKEGEGEG